jgi:hypothetical protein
LNVILFVARDMAREKYGIPISIVANETLDLSTLRACLGRFLEFPCCLVVSPEAKKVAFRFIK